ncbi:MAG: hypothetical protein HFH28_05735 [Clostridiaceae bacterium]|nr:hypothetical protein [Clostridiaceae bacterium]
MSTQQQQPQLTVEEQQQVIKDLLATGKKNGKLSLKEIADALQSLELESEDIDKLYETIENMGIEIEGADVLAPVMSADEDFEAAEVEELPEEELVDTSALAEGFAIDDPVRMYLKEIGKVDLLSPEEEQELAEQMTAGAEAVEAIGKLEADPVKLHDKRLPSMKLPSLVRFLLHQLAFQGAFLRQPLILSVFFFSCFAGFYAFCR